MRIYLINLLVLVSFLAGCGGSNVIDTKKPVSSRISDTDLIFHCRKPDFLSAHPSYSRELEKRGLRDRCYDNPKVKEEVDEELEKKAKREAELKAKLAARAELMNTAPASWSNKQRRLFAKYSDDHCYIVQKWAKLNDKNDKRAIKASLGNKGLIARDIDLIFDPKADYGTGMSYKGVRCQGGRVVNKSYYPGLGHTWQMTFNDSYDYVYLEGNGKERNMRAKSWN